MDALWVTFEFGEISVWGSIHDIG